MLTYLTQTRQVLCFNISGFHEGIANTISLSVFNTNHLHRIGLINNTDTYESSINFLMLMALKKVAYAPFAYLVDQVHQFRNLFLNLFPNYMHF